jgi:hypothetical protein
MPLTFYFWKASTSVNRRRSSASASSRCCSRKPKLQSPILYSDYLLSDGNEMVAHSCRLGFDGIISKNAEAPYRSDRDEDLLKIKCAQKGKFPVIGFVKDPTGVAALYLEKREGKELRYIGKVGTGCPRTELAHAFGQELATRIRARLDAPDHPRQLGRLDCLGPGGNRQALLQQRLQPLLAHTVAPARQRRAIEHQPVLEELLAAEELVIGVLDPRSHSTSSEKYTCA